MTVLYNAIPTSFSGTANAGSGTVTRFTYTVPAGKVAELEVSYVQINGNANAANTTQALIAINNGGTSVRTIFLDNSAVANSNAASITGSTYLQAADVVQGFTVNTGAANVTMIIAITVREYL